MSVAGFDALGHWALGHPDSGTVLSAAAGSFALSGQPATFNLTENVTAGSFSVAGPSITEIIGVVSGVFTFTGPAQVLNISENAAAASYVITGSIANNLSGVSSPGAFNLTGAAAALIWTGAGVDTSYTGGVGHYLEELEQQKRLNAITRKIPAPVDRRTIPRFEALRGPPSAPAAPVPAVAAIPPQPMAAAQADAETAKRRRRDEEAVLLLAC